MRKIKTDKPANTAKPAKAKADKKPATGAPATPAPDNGEKRIARCVTNDARTIAAYATHYGKLSARDEAYLALYASVSDKTGKFTLADLAKLARNPYYSGSAKASDAGAINRARRGGSIKPVSADCREFTLTAKAFAYGRNVLAKAKAASKPAPAPVTPAPAQ